MRSGLRTVAGRAGTRPARPSPGFVRRLPISVRLGVASALGFLLLLVALSAVAYWGLGQTLRDEIDRSLVSAVNTLAERAEPTDIDDRQVGGVESAEFDAQLMTVDGRVRGASDDDLLDEPLLSPEQAATVLRDGSLFLDVRDRDGEAHRALAVPLDRAGSDVILAVAELESVETAQQGLLRLAVLILPVAGVLAGGAGWLVARQGLRPIAQMTADAERISARDPFPRLAVPTTHDEVAHLGRTLNQLLDRIEEGRRREREFTADASHELRTPLTVLRTELELARKHATDQGFVEALDSALEESDRLGHLIDDLLLLARTDAGHLSTQDLIDIADVVDGLMPGFRTLAARRGIALSRSGDAVVRADARALGRAIANLLDNAIRHAPDGGRVALSIAQEPDWTTVTVTDDGPGVPPGDRERITQRFAQLNRSEIRPGGAGLGLSIVGSVVAAHGGRLEIGDPPSGRGLSVTIRLPRA